MIDYAIPQYVQRANQNEIYDYCLAYAVIENDTEIIVAAMLKPYPSRSARIVALNKLKNLLNVNDKTIMVTADVDVFVKVDSGNNSFDEIKRILIKRGSFV